MGEICFQQNTWSYLAFAASTRTDDPPDPLIERVSRGDANRKRVDRKKQPEKLVAVKQDGTRSYGAVIAMRALPAVTPRVVNRPARVSRAAVIGAAGR